MTEPFERDRILNSYEKIFRKDLGLNEEKMDMGKIHSEIKKFLTKNPKPSDKEIHALANELGIDEHEFEEHIYMILGSLLKKNEESLDEENLDERAGYSNLETVLKDLDKVAAKSQKMIDKAIADVDKRINLDMRNVGSPNKKEYYKAAIELLRDKYPEISAELGYDADWY